MKTHSAIIENRNNIKWIDNARKRLKKEQQITEKQGEMIAEILEALQDTEDKAVDYHWRMSVWCQAYWDLYGKQNRDLGYRAKDDGYCSNEEHV